MVRLGDTGGTLAADAAHMESSARAARESTQEERDG
ncbi:MAG: hypothetical protein QOH00_2608 [Gaiellales bacterium]|jgi:hypothetical protein|nr:hypothetical protein [Gaiellales bacterium]